MTTSTPPAAQGVFWISKCCGSLNRGSSKECWNCNGKRDRARTAAVTHEICEFCGLEYLGLAGRFGEHMSMCPFYFEHYGDYAYYPPNMVPILLLELNGYMYDEAAGKVVRGPK